MIELHLLGRLELRRSDGEALLSILAQPKRAALLAYLAIAGPSGFHRRDKLLGLFWPDSDAERARSALRTALYFLRQSLGDEVVVSRGEEEVGLAAEAIICDVVAFEASLEQGETEKAVELYRGALLDGFHVSGVPEFERWVEFERQRLFDACAKALETLAEEAEAVEDRQQAVDWWRRAIHHDPYNSRYALRLMQAMAAAGDRGNALHFAQEHERRLREDLGMEPDAELLALSEQLRNATEREGEQTAEAVSTVGAAKHVSSRDAPLRRLTWRKGMLMATLAVALAIAIVSVVPRGQTPDPNRVAVFPFTVHGSRDLAYLREGVADLLSTALDGAGELRTVDSHALLSYVRRSTEETGPEEVRRVARHFDAGHYVLGSVVTGGGPIQVNAALYDYQGSVVTRARATMSDDGELLELGDEISRQLLTAGTGGPGTRLSKLAGND